jgi:outer membrane protein OmpA-like peptidoglycan-associated protein
MAARGFDSMARSLGPVLKLCGLSAALPGRPREAAGRPFLTGIGLVLAATAVPAQARSACPPLVAAFNAAIDTAREADAQAAIDRIATEPACGGFVAPAQRRLAAFRLSAVQILMARGRPAADYERLLTAADKPQVFWQAAATLAEVRFGERRFDDAARAFDRAIEIVKNETATPATPPKDQIENLIARAGQSRLLAAIGRSAKGAATFVKTARNERDGKLGGFYSESVRGIVPHAIPIPITFEYREATFTTIGEQAAQELLTAIREQRPAKVALVGHTDPRGSDETNMRLSRERADAVATFLRQNGVTAPIEVAGKGAKEPLRFPDDAGLSKDDIYAIDRRVEWRRE